MRITPLDIRKQEFHKAMRGLDSEEVYAFLSTVGDEYETLLNDNKALRERVLELDDKVQEYRTMEKTLRDTLITAERVTVEAKDNARREANLIIKEAQIEAEKALRDIKNESMRLHHEVQQLRQQRDGFLARMKAIAESHLKYIEAAQRDVTEDDELSREGLSQAVSAKEKTRSDSENKHTTHQTFAAPASETFGSHRSERGTGSAPVESGAGDRKPTEIDSVKPAVTSGDDTGQVPFQAYGQRQRGTNTLADINEILDRMAEGGVETGLAQEPSESARETQSADLFEPIPDPPVEVEEEDRAEARQAASGYRQDSPAPGTRIPVGRAWDYVTADNTGVPRAEEPAETEPDTETEYDPLSALDKDRDRG